MEKETKQRRRYYDSVIILITDYVPSEGNIHTYPQTRGRTRKRIRAEDVQLYCTLILNQLLGLPKQVEIHHGLQYW